jgi:methylmalonyl-CoA mutase
MPDRGAPLGPLRLAHEFPPVATEAWTEAVRQDLKGADADGRLVWRTGEGVDVRPFYRAEDLPSGPQAGGAPGEPPWVRGSGRPWTAGDASAIPSNAVRVDRLHDAGATAVQEIGYALAEGVDRLAAAVAGGARTADVASGLTFVFAIGSLYFVEIAKLRAARLCWAQAVAAFEEVPADAARMRTVARTARSNKGRYDPYTNLLRVTTEAMAAACAGADTVIVEDAGFDPHLATNVTRILGEESHLDAVADPGGGAYYVEALTDALARAAWTLLQEVEAAGGYAAVEASGALGRAVAASRLEREQAVASRRRTLVGINNYPDLGETSPSWDPDAREGSGGLPAWRMAAPFEHIRERTERHAVATGRRPRVLLLTRGDVRMRTARAAFALNFFGAAGFDVVQAEASGPDPADLVVLCSADAEYLALAREVCPRVRVPVIVAGHPTGDVAALEAAGVSGFVHARSNAVEELARWQDVLGMGRTR